MVRFRCHRARAVPNSLAEGSPPPLCRPPIPKKGNTMKTVLAILVACSLAGVSLADSPIFFSEYLEGSSNNKAVEIYNNTNQPIDLSRVVVERYNNGSMTLSYTATLSGTLAAGDVWVIANAGSVQAILDVADDVVHSEFTFYNGDDVLLLYWDGILQDSIGRLGEDPGSEWGIGTATTLNHTLVRKASDCTGDVDSSDVYDPAVNYDGFALDTFTDLGTHTNNCTIVAAESSTWGAVKGLFR